MKKLRTFVCLLLACLFGYLCFHVIKKRYAEGEYVSEYEGRESLVLTVDNMAVLKNKYGSVILGIRRIERESVYYKWRFYDAISKKLTTGVGAAKYRELELDDRNGVAVMLDYGSDECLDAGKIKVLWTPNNATSIWIYHKPVLTTVEIMPNHFYDEYRIKSHL